MYNEVRQETSNNNKVLTPLLLFFVYIFVFEFLLDAWVVTYASWFLTRFTNILYYLLLMLNINANNPASV